MDIGQRYTEAQMKQIERRLKSIYKEAEQDVGRKLREFNKAHRERDAKYRAAVKAGEMSKEDYQAWLRGQVFQGEQWKAKRMQMAKSLNHANEQAMAIVNGTRFNVFAENANFMEYEIGMGAGLTGAQFGLYDARTVQRLAADDPKLLPPSKVSYPKDMAWNMKKLNNALTQGIIQGEGIDDIAQRMANVTGSSRKAMVLHARTAMTGAQNAGRLEGMRAAERLGLKVKKQWMATLDDRTRDSHQVLDGQVQDIDKPFDSILGPIMHPGDPSADPANVYNCRCTLIYVFDDESFSGERRDEEADEDIGYQTYSEWKRARSGEPPEPVAPPKREYDVRGNTKKLSGIMQSDDYEEAVQMIGESDAAAVYEKYGDSCRTIRIGRSGYYMPGADLVEFRYEAHEGRSKYSVMAHEMAHMFDAHMGKADGLHFLEVEMINSHCVIGSGAVQTLQGSVSLSDEFLGAMRKDKAALQAILDDAAELQKMRTGRARNATAGVQDAMDGFFGTQKKGLLPWGHGEKYYNRQYNQRIVGFGNEDNLREAYKELGFTHKNKSAVKTQMRDYETASELWANTVSAITCGGEELEAFERYMPNTVAMARQILRGV